MHEMSKKLKEDIDMVKRELINKKICIDSWDNFDFVAYFYKTRYPFTTGVNFFSLPRNGNLIKKIDFDTWAKRDSLK